MGIVGRMPVAISAYDRGVQARDQESVERQDNHVMIGRRGSGFREV